MLSDKVKGKQRAVELEHLSTTRSTETVPVLVPRTASTSAVTVLREAKIDLSPSPGPSSGITLLNSRPIPDLHPLFDRPAQASPFPPATTFRPLSKPSLSGTPHPPDVPRSRFCPVINRRCSHFEGIHPFFPSIQPPSVLHAEYPTNHPSSSTFISGPSKILPSLTAVPLVPLRLVYQGYPSLNRFFCAGRLLTSGDSPRPFIVTLATFVAISATWLSTTCVWWWQNESPAVACIGAYLTLLTISCMLATAFRDPGILPRGLDLDPPLPATSPSGGGERVPLPRDLKVRTATMCVKYCLPCSTYRPPRCEHCTACDNCVDRWDHHCVLMNNCIGRRNYTFFFCLLLFSVLTLFLTLGTSARQLTFTRDHANIPQPRYQSVGSTIVFILSIPAMMLSMVKLLHQIIFLPGNTTMAEAFYGPTYGTFILMNPFSFGSWRANVAEMLCRPAGFSWLNAHAVVTEDKRRVNPGLDA